GGGARAEERLTGERGLCRRRRDRHAHQGWVEPRELAARVGGLLGDPHRRHPRAGTGCGGGRGDVDARAPATPRADGRGGGGDGEPGGRKPGFVGDAGLVLVWGWQAGAQAASAARGARRRVRGLERLAERGGASPDAAPGHQRRGPGRRARQEPPAARAPAGRDGRGGAIGGAPVPRSTSRAGRAAGAGIAGDVSESLAGAGSVAAARSSSRRVDARRAAQHGASARRARRRTPAPSPPAARWGAGARTGRAGGGAAERHTSAAARTARVKYPAAPCAACSRRARRGRAASSREAAWGALACGAGRGEGGGSRGARRGHPASTSEAR
ncbi:hypothetical protein T484DRAFT_1907235, partial [Baffinella frigidus]